MHEVQPGVPHPAANVQFLPRQADRLLEVAPSDKGFRGVFPPEVTFIFA
jgi:hypothetical protein